jgi:hypothetical protein
MFSRSQIIDSVIISDSNKLFVYTNSKQSLLSYLVTKLQKPHRDTEIPNFSNTAQTTPILTFDLFDCNQILNPISSTYNLPLNNCLRPLPSSLPSTKPHTKTVGSILKTRKRGDSKNRNIMELPL